MEKAFEKVFDEQMDLSLPNLLTSIPVLMNAYTDLEMEAFNQLMPVDEGSLMPLIRESAAVENRLEE